MLKVKLIVKIISYTNEPVPLPVTRSRLRPEAKGAWKDIATTACT